jgi:hypothetical protein
MDFARIINSKLHGDWVSPNKIYLVHGILDFNVKEAVPFTNSEQADKPCNMKMVKDKFRGQK